MSDDPAQTPPDPPEPAPVPAPPPGQAVPAPEPVHAADRARPARRGAWRGIARGFGSVAAVAAVVVLVVVSRDGLGSGGGSHAAIPAAVGTRVAPAALPGLQATPAPWPAEYADLAQRMAALGLPDLSDTVFHIHAMLRIYVDGRPITVPANIGLPDQGNAFSPLHTHDATGIIHIESTRPYAFTLGQFFDVWGVAFTPTQLGAYRTGGAHTVSVYVNGHKVADGPAHRMQAHDSIAVGYGRPGSFPTNLPGDFSGGL